MRALVTSVRASQRLDRARAFLQHTPADGDVLVLGASHEASADLLRSLRRPVLGWRHTTLFRAAAELARPELFSRGLALGTPLALEALWAQITHQLHVEGGLGRLDVLHDRPGLARALKKTIDELRLAGTPVEQLSPELQSAAQAFERALANAKLADAAQVYRLALEALQAPAALAESLVLVDLPALPRLPQLVLSAMVGRCARAFAVAPGFDERAVAQQSQALGVEPEVLAPALDTPLGVLQQNLFQKSRQGAELQLEGMFSAPGEVREAVEIARRLIERARAGVRYDQMAVLLRSPGAYRAALAEAFRRAAIPAHFARGTSKPDPTGRSLLSLLRCAEEGLSARRFAEYLSLGQLPKADEGGTPPRARDESRRHARPEAEETLLPLDDDQPDDEAAGDADGALDDDGEATQAPVVAGQLRAPRKWELLINDAAVIGGADRWRARLEGLRELRLQASRAPDLTEGQQAYIERELADLQSLTDFALPLIDDLAALPNSARWQVWLDALAGLATRAIRRPERVLAVLADLAPMAEVGPVTLREVRSVLTQRLSEITETPAKRRHGRVFVAPVELARGLQFDTVFVPGLAERVFPQKLKEDPLLSDLERLKLGGLETNAERIVAERLALQLSVGAAEVGLQLSYPRIDAEQARPRVPSFYGLELTRAVEGRLLPFEDLQRRAEAGGQARLAWPAPQQPMQAIDDTEYDLATLERVLAATDDVTGRARYLVDANAHLARALRARHMRWQMNGWTPADGLVKPSALGHEALVAHQFGARSFSPTALEQFAACPYKFFLSAIARLQPLEIPEEIEELGPLEKGSLAHEVLFRLLSQLQRDEVRVVEQTLQPTVFRRLDQVIDAVSREYRDKFVPAIERVWHDGIESLRADLREVLRTIAAHPEWQPHRFELSFGLANRELADAHSSRAPVQLDHGLQLRGSIDLVEKRSDGVLRATDYKTGKARAEPGNVVGGGRHLQPVLYALTIEKLFEGQPVEGGRLWYCTQAGGFTEVPTALDPRSRESLGQVVLELRRCLEVGEFPAAPDEGECRYCNYRNVCGPEEERRTAKKQRSLKALAAIRRLP